MDNDNLNNNEGALTYEDVSKLAGEVGEDGTIIIPQKYTTIRDGAFHNITCKRIVVGDNIKQIDAGAFIKADADEIDLTDCKIKEVPVLAFKNSMAEKIILPNTITKIGLEAFNSCYNLKNIDIPSSVKKIEDDAFYYCRGLKSVTIPDSVVSLGRGAFKECTRLKRVTLPNSLKQIDINTFYDCTALEEIEIPDSVVGIEGYAFASCENLKKVKLSNNLKFISNNAFDSCKKLEEIELPESLLSIEYGAFEECEELKKIKIPSQVKAIDRKAFYSCKNLEEVDFGNVEVIEKEAFAFCKIKDLILPKSVRVIGEDAFGDCKIKNLYIPNGVEEIEDFAFQDNKDIEYVELPDSVKKLGKYIFSGCYYLKYIKFPNTLEELSYQGDLGDVEEIVLPEKLSILGEKAFIDSSNLKYIKFPETLTEIGKSALANTGIEHIDLPKNITKIGDEAFSYCMSLKEIEIPEKVTSLATKLFENCLELKDVKFNDNLKYINAEAFKGCKSLTSLEFPKNVMYVEENVFEGCDNLENIVFHGRVSFMDSFNNLPPKTKRISCGEGSRIEGTIKISPLRYYTKKQGQILLTDEPVDETSFCFGDFVREEGEQTRFEILFEFYEERESLKKLFKECPMCIVLFNKLYELNGIKWLKNFYHENKDSLKFFKQCAKLVPAGLESEFCILYYDLGGFEKNYVSVKKDKDGKEIVKTTNYAQKVGELLKMMLTQETWFFDKSYLKKLNFEGIKEDFSDFILKKENFLETIRECQNIPEFFARFYNEIEKAQMHNTSNKGSQRQLKPTVKSFKNFMLSSYFLGANNHPEIAYALQKYYSEQETFDDAVKIDNERIGKGTPKSILKTNVAGFANIKELANNILDKAGSAMHYIVDATNNLSYEFLSKDDPNNFILGKMVNCCAHLEGAGYGIMHASIVHPDVQNLVIRDEKGKIIAKSTLYINRKEGYGVFNNVEINENIQEYQKDNIYNAYLKAVRDFAAAYNKENPDKELRILTVGANANDLSGLLLKKNKVSNTNYMAINYGLYGKDQKIYAGDSSTKQYVVWEKDGEKEE